MRCEDILSRFQEIEGLTGIRRTIFAACPNSRAVTRAALRSAKRCNAPVKFAATLNQVDLDGGYTQFTQKEFVSFIRQESVRINLTAPVIIAIDHGGPWLKDKQRTEKWPYDAAMAGIKESFEAAVDAGYHLIHVDPTVDISLKGNATISIDVVAARTLELIGHTEHYRRKRNLPKISYEVGTEEVHGGLANLNAFTRFLHLLKTGLDEKGLGDAWPCFIVGKVGTDLHTTLFDKEVAWTLANIASDYGSYIKGHYTDNVENPQDYPASGMGAANVGPEFTEREYDGLMELERIESDLISKGKVIVAGNIKEALREAVIQSHRWEKWLLPEEVTGDFYTLKPERQEWLIKTGCRYIWENTGVVTARQKLYDNLEEAGIDGEEIVLSHIERAMEKYFFHFNLIDSNTYL
jgi:tagatose-1,6-bisphosphate aldolase non-catalytic subunit AgaZ/GatZ